MTTNTTNDKKRRKDWARAAATVFLALAMSACNADIFIDDFLPQTPSLRIERAGETVSIPFEATNWGILWGYNIDESFHTWSTDLEGNSLSLPFDEEQLGIVHIQDDFFDLQVEKKNRREMSVTLLENLYDYPIEMSLAVGNQYVEKRIPLTLAPGSKYRVDSVAYDWSQFHTYDYGAEWVYSLIVDNTMSADTIWATIRPYEDAVRSVRFSIPGTVMPADYYTTILGSPLPEVTIPDIEDGQPVLQDTRATFNLHEQDLPAGLDKNFSTRVPVPGGKNMKVGVYVTIENYTVPFTLHCSNPDSGRTRTFSGTLTSDRPYDYFYVKEDLSETNE